MVLFKCCTQYVSKFGKLSCGHRTEKVNFTPIAKRAMPKNILATVELYSFHMLTRLCSKSFKLGFSSSWTENIQTHKLGKGSGTRDQIVKIGWIMEKARKSQKNICFIDYSEAFDCIDHNKKKKENVKECSNYHIIEFISHVSRVMLKILQARLQQYMNRELSDVQAAFRKCRGSNCQHLLYHKKKAEFQKNIYFCFIGYD